MYKNKTICVVVPAYNEEHLIERTLTTLPAWVDHVVVVDDCSQDDTVSRVRALMDRMSREAVVKSQNPETVERANERTASTAMARFHLLHFSR